MSEPETKLESNMNFKQSGMKFVFRDSTAALPLPDNWKFETRSTFFKIAIAPDKKAYWIAETISGYELFEYKIATMQDVEKTRGALRLGKSFIGEKFDGWKNTSVGATTLS